MKMQCNKETRNYEKEQIKIRKINCQDRNWAQRL